MAPIPQVSKTDTIIQRIAKRKMLIYGASFLGFSASALSLNFATPLYEAKSKIAFNSIHAISIEGHAAGLSSPSLALSIIDELNLAPLSKHADTSQSLFKDMKFDNAKKKHDALLTLEEAQNVASFLKNLSAKRLDNSNVIEVSYRHTDAYLAALISNKIAFHYIENLQKQNTNQQDTPNVLLQDLDAQIKKLNKEIYEINQTILNTGRSTQTPHKTRDLSSKKRQLNALEEQKNTLFLDDGSININAQAPLLHHDDVLHTLKSERAKKEQSLKDLSIYYGPKHPTIITLNQEIETLNNKILLRSTHLANSVLEQYESLKSKLAVFEETHNSDADEKIALLQAQKDEKQGYLKKLIALKETYTQQQLRKNEEQMLRNKPAKIIAQASIPTQAIFPNKVATLLRGTALAFLLSLGFSALIERRRKTFLSGRQLEEYLQKPCFALIPKANAKIGSMMVEDVFNEDSSQLADSVRSLRLNLNLHAKMQERKNQVITLTSSMSGEGKSTLACWMAKLAAQAGERVILIDADLRKPRVHDYLDRENIITISDHLQGNAPLEDIIDYTDPSGMHAIYARSMAGHAMNLISSKNMENMIRKLRKNYDLIIIDTPACMAVADAKAIARHSDQLLYVVSWDGVKKEVVHNGISQFTKSGNTDIATVLTNVDIKKHVNFGYGDIINAYDDYKEYAPI